MKKILLLFLLPCMMFFAAISFAGGQVIDGKNTQVLFVLLSQKASIHAIDHQPGKYLLTLKGVNSRVVYFSDRPARISGQITMRKFLEQWHTGSFSKSAPNAVMEAVRLNVNSTIKSHAEQQTSYAIVLNHPVYHQQTDEVSFEITAMPGNARAIPMIANSDYVAIFVDQVCLSCIG